jgi:hypothetical protein
MPARARMSSASLAVLDPFQSHCVCATLGPLFLSLSPVILPRRAPVQR